MADVALATPPADITRKRSRSRSPSEQHVEPKLKRHNTGTTIDKSTASNGTKAENGNSESDAAHDSSRVLDDPASTASVAVPAPINDVSMNETANDTAASTPTGADAKAGSSSSSAPQADTQSGVMNNAIASGDSATPSAMIHMRCLIVTQDASIIIGRGGKHVNEIREKSGARVMVSESVAGNPERILNVSGPLDAVSKVSPVLLHDEAAF